MNIEHRSEERTASLISMFNVRTMSTPLSRKNLPENPPPDDILNAFLDYLTGTEPCDHREEAILELFASKFIQPFD